MLTFGVVIFDFRGTSFFSKLFRIDELTRKMSGHVIQSLTFQFVLKCFPTMKAISTFSFYHTVNFVSDQTEQLTEMCLYLQKYENI